jgi:hypothetical protein
VASNMKSFANASTFEVWPGDVGLVHRTSFDGQGIVSFGRCEEEVGSAALFA